MVERPADVLPMDKSRPVNIAWFIRLDAALRRIPGLGIFIALALVDNLYERAHFVALAAFLFSIAVALGQEFIKPPKE